MDLLAVHRAALDCVARARAGRGPSFLICNTYRYGGHHVGDTQDYKGDAERKAWAKKDPIGRFARHLAAKRIADRERLDALTAGRTQPAP